MDPESPLSSCSHPELPFSNITQLGLFPPDVPLKADVVPFLSPYFSQGGLAKCKQDCIIDCSQLCAGLPLHLVEIPEMPAYPGFQGSAWLVSVSISSPSLNGHLLTALKPPEPLPLAGMAHAFSCHSAFAHDVPIALCPPCP